MNEKLAELERRRQRLIFQSAVQRDRLIESWRQLGNSTKLVHLLRGVVQSVTAGPAPLVGLSALLAGMRKTKFRNWTSLLSLGWTIFHGFQAWRRRPRA